MEAVMERGESLVLLLLRGRATQVVSWGGDG